MRRIWLRFDAGSSFGGGHASRLLPVARQLARQHEVSLLTRTPFEVTRLVRLHVPKTLLPVGCGAAAVTDEDAWLSATLCDAADGPHVLVIDHPHAYAPEVLCRLRQRGLKVVLVDRFHVPDEAYDLMIWPHLHGPQPERVPRLLHGAGVVLTSAAVQHARWRPALSTRPQWLTCVAGSSDPDGMLPRLYTLTRGLKTRRSMTIRLYGVGQQAVWPATVDVSSDAMITGYSPALLLCPLVVSAWGVTVYECLALGTPVIAIARRPHEREDIARLAAATAGACIDGTAAYEAGGDAMVRLLQSLWDHQDGLERMHRATEDLLDAEHAPERVATAIATVGDPEPYA